MSPGKTGGSPCAIPATCVSVTLAAKSAISTNDDARRQRRTAQLLIYISDLLSCQGGPLDRDDTVTKVPAGSKAPPRFFRRWLSFG
jgi:hypothetical protein